VKQLKWRIYYGDGTSFDNTQGSPKDAPTLDVQVIVVADDDVGRQLLHLWDWYYFDLDDNQWCGADIYGVLDQFMHRNVEALKQGRTLPQRDFDAIKQRAIDETIFLVETGKKRLETPKRQVWGDGKNA